MRRTQGPSDTVRYSHLGIQFALVVILGIWAGAWLDRKLSTNLFTLIGTFAGAGIGFYFLYRETRRIGDGPDDEASSGAAAGSGSPDDHDDAPALLPPDSGGPDSDRTRPRGDRGNSGDDPGR
ncbi:AtpZ/AtpI family protein [bacterium]|nr:AtpZ/AtpI family protein [bacterium]